MYWSAKKAWAGGLRWPPNPLPHVQPLSWLRFSAPKAVSHSWNPVEPKNLKIPAALYVLDPLKMLLPPLDNPKKVCPPPQKKTNALPPVKKCHDRSFTRFLSKIGTFSGGTPSIFLYYKKMLNQSGESLLTGLHRKVLTEWTRKAKHVLNWLSWQ